MSFKKIFLMFIVLSLCVVVTPVTIYAQDYDYHREESPAVSWNGVVLFDARMLAAGGISLMASPAFSATINPALIPAGNNIFMGGSFESMKHEAFQYWAINQGVYGDPDPQSGQNNRLSGFSVVFPFKGLRFSAGWYVGSLLELPAFDYESQYWAYFLRSTGIENNFFAAAAFKLGKSIEIGVKMDVVSGKRDVSIYETWKEYPLQFLHEERHRLSYLVPSIGALLKISPAWTVGAAMIYPLRGKAKRTIDRVFESEYERIEILDQQSTDTLYRPARFYLGTTITPFTNPNNPGKTRLTLAAEMVYTPWSDYRYDFYSEILPREMKNTLVLALGMEFGLLATNSDYFARIGYRLDPQPITNPEISQQAITGGIGLRIGSVSLDAGAIYYFSSYLGVKQRHLVLNSTLYIRL
jgi:hypothetical protein